MCFEMLKSCRGSRQIFDRESKCSRHYEKSFSNNNNNTMYRSKPDGFSNVNEISRSRTFKGYSFELFAVSMIDAALPKLTFSSTTKRSCFEA